IGIQESLCRKNPALKEAFQAGSDYILHALNLGVTGGNTIRGVGLANVKKTVAGEKGSLTIRTMRSKIQFGEGKPEVWDDLPLIPGVQVFMTIWESPSWLQSVAFSLL